MYVQAAQIRLWVFVVVCLFSKEDTKLRCEVFGDVDLRGARGRSGE